MASVWWQIASTNTAVIGEDFVPTPVGTARITWYPARGSVRAVALLGHGSVTGIESPDLQALADALPPRDVTVALVTQPYRLEAKSGRRR